MAEVLPLFPFIHQHFGEHLGLANRPLMLYENDHGSLMLFFGRERGCKDGFFASNVANKL